MSLKTNNAEGGTDGVSVSTLNSGGTSGVAWDLVNIGSGAIMAYIAAGAIHGSLSVRCQTSTSTSTPLVRWVDTANASVTVRWYWKWSTLPSATNQVGANVRGNTAGTSLARTEVDSTGHIRLVVGSGASAFTTAAMVTGTVYMVEMVCTGLGTAASAGTLNLYQADGTTLIESKSLSAQTTSFTADTVQFGKINGAANLDVLFDSMAANIGSSTPLGPANNPPLCDAGADQSNVEAYSTVTVTGTDSDSDGTVAVRTWRVVSISDGAVPALSGSGQSRTFKAPGTLGGSVIVLGYKVTDNGGLDSIEDFCSVAVLPATERIVQGGVEVPVEVDVVS